MRDLSTTYSLIHGIVGNSVRPSNAIHTDTRSRKSTQIEAHFAELALASEILSYVLEGTPIDTEHSNCHRYLAAVYERAGLENPQAIATNFFTEITGKLAMTKKFASTSSQSSLEANYPH